MKTLKFAPHLVEKIRSGEKTSTWRLFDDKDLKVGDEVTFINRDTKDAFGSALIQNVVIKTLGTLADADWEGHERYATEEEMYKTFKDFYGDKVNENTEVKILSYQFSKK